LKILIIYKDCCQSVELIFSEFSFNVLSFPLLIYAMPDQDTFRRNDKGTEIYLEREERLWPLEGM